MIPHPSRSTLFPYTTLFRSVDLAVQLRTSAMLSLSGSLADCLAFGLPTVTTVDLAAEMEDRKSTRLNSSHQIISYAVFCLKKKKTFIPFLFNLSSSATALTR